MKKSLFLAALAALSLASCSNDEVLEIKQNAITFDVVSDNASRALDIYSATNTPDKFKVYAVHTDASNNKTMYIDGVTVEKSSTGYAFADGAARYWPESGSLTFYAIVQPDEVDGVDFVEPTTTDPDGSYKMNGTSFTSYGFDLKFDESYNAYLPQQRIQQLFGTSRYHHDLIYAVKVGQAKTTNGGKVALNFRHAYAQVVFKAKNLSPKTLHVVLDNVSIVNIYSSGQFNLPLTSTDENVTTTNGKPLNNQGNWTNLQPVTFNNSLSGCSMSTSFDEKDELNQIVGESEVDLSTLKRELMIIPVENSAYVKTTNETGSYFDILCEVYNIAGESYNASTDKLVRQNAQIPIDINWEQGKKYIYTLLFGSDGQISFELTVDDYISGSADKDVIVY